MVGNAPTFSGGKLILSINWCETLLIHNLTDRGFHDYTIKIKRIATLQP